MKTGVGAARPGVQAAIECNIVQPGAVRFAWVQDEHVVAEAFLNPIDALDFGALVCKHALALGHALLSEGVREKKVDVAARSADRLVMSAAEIAAQKNVIPILPRR